jgi:E1-E2 ATPase
MESNATADSRQMVMGPANGRVRRTVRASEEVLLPGLRIKFHSSEPVLILGGETIAAAAKAPTRRQLINRLFSIPSLQSLRMNRRKGEVRLEFAARLHSTADVLATLAEAMGGRPPIALPLPHEEVILRNKGSSSFEIHRCGSGLTLWRVEAPSSRMYRLSHPLLKSEFVRKEVLDELGTLPDVVHQSLSVLLSSGETLLVFVRPHRLDPTVFQDVLDPVLTRCLSTAESNHRPSFSGWMVNANLALAPIADFLFPPLGMFNLALTSLISLKYIPRALLSLRKGKFTVELLYLASTVFTGLTFEFLPAAVMYWFMRFWPRRSGQLYELHHSKFLARYRRRPRRVWVERDGASVETRVEELLPSSVVTLTAGDIVPGDGRIVSGTAQINEELLNGNSLDIPKSEGDSIYAASRIVDGAVRIRIASLGADTAAGRIALWHREALERQASEHRAAEIADRTTLPILLVGAAALVGGGLSMAKTTIRPDYLTGPTITEKMSGLATVIRAATEGIVIAGNRYLQKLLKCDSIVFDDSVQWQTPETGQVTFERMVLNQGLAEVVFFAGGSEKNAATLASRLGFQSFHSGSSTASKRSYLEQRQKLGHSVIYVGDCVSQREVAEQADVAISVLELPYDKPNKSPIALLFPDLVKILQLRAIAADALDEFKLGFGLSLAPNLAAVFGALFLASPTSVAVLLTNLGMLADYVRSAAVLYRAELEERTNTLPSEAKRPALVSPTY